MRVNLVRLCLLGDSCHATMPNIGQGAGLAFEDGYELAKTLGAAGAAVSPTRTAPHRTAECC